MYLDDTHTRCDKCRILITAGDATNLLVALEWPEAICLDLCTLCATVAGVLVAPDGVPFVQGDRGLRYISHAEVLQRLGLHAAAGERI